ncbi:MAG TPA: VWA domain-containing protein [Candidatus Eisenbacteria bacterium]|nr:VWA domain-containing protein [Candidatus Eisenbacteria bacterium]
MHNSFRVWVRLYVSWALGGLLACAAGAQTATNSKAQSIPTIKVRTQLVLIPAEVTDSKGSRVSDMKKDDFAVFENGKRQEIALFEHVVTKAEVTKPTLPRPGEFSNTVQQGSGRITIFVVDLLNSRIEEQKEARKQLIDFLSRSLDVEEPLCLIAVNARGAWLIHSFTTDPKDLVRALQAERVEKTQMDQPQKNPEEELYKTVEGWNSKDTRRAEGGLEARLNILRMSVGFEDMEANDRIRLTLQALSEIGNAFIGIPGRKSLIWATAGLPFAVNNADALEKDGALHGSDRPGLLPLYEQTWRTLEEAKIAVYPLDVSELLNPAFVSAGMGEPLPQHVLMDTHVGNLENFAAVTGGRFCSRSMDAKKCFEEAAADSSDYYLLGIYDKSGREQPGWRTLSVRTPRPGITIHARSGYYLGTTALNSSTDTELMETALSSPLDYTGLALNVRLMGTTDSRERGKKEIRFEYAIPEGAIRLDGENRNQLKLEFAAAARDSSGKLAGTFSKTVEGRLSALQVSQVEKKGILFTGTIQLPPGEYGLSFAVIDRVNDNTGSVTAPVTVK